MTGRPTTYTQELANLICARVCENRRGLRGVCQADDMPARSTVYLWLQEHKDFSDQYARACEVRAHDLADEIIEISDDGSKDTYEDDEGREHVNTDVIARARLRVDSRKWLSSKLAPKRYGDKVETTLLGDPEKPVIHKIELVAEPFPADHPKYK